MQITRNATQTMAGPSERFTGAVYIDAVAVPAGPSRPQASSVHFTPGARTAWHTHPKGQTIYVTEGVGLAQRRGEPIEVIRPGHPGVLRARREPLARRDPDPVHGAPGDPAGRRVGVAGDLGRARDRRAVRELARPDIPRRATWARRLTG